MNNNDNLKTLFFYHIYLDPIPLYGTSQEMLLKAFDYPINKPITNTKKSYVMEILNIGESFIFASIGKCAELKRKAMQRNRDENMETINIDNILENKYVEDYTFFFIDVLKMNAVVLYNQSAPQFRRHAEIFIKTRLSGEYEKVLIAPIKVDDIKAKLKSLTKLSKLRFVFSKPLAEKNFSYVPSTEATFRAFDNSLEEIIIDLKMKQHSHNLASNDLVDELCTAANDEGLTKAKITGYFDEDSEITESFEIIERCLTKRVSIVLGEDALSSTENNFLIMKELQNALLSQID